MIQTSTASDKASWEKNLNYFTEEKGSEVLLEQCYVEQGQIRRNDVLANLHFYQKQKVLQIVSRASLCITFLDYCSEIMKKPQESQSRRS